MWLFPYLTYATIIILLGIFVAQAFIEDMCLQFYLTSLIAVLVIASYFVFYRKKQPSSGFEERQIEKGSTR